MTVIEFYQNLLRGKGSCYSAVKAAPSAYHNVLMNAATRSTAFDPQCEGTRADYIYELLALTGNAKPYLDAAIVALHDASPLRRGNLSEPEDDEEPSFARNPSPTDDDFHFLSELLALFAKDKNSIALTALVKEYDALFCHLRDRKERPDLFFPERDDFEGLVITLCDYGLCDPIIAIRDIGKLLRDNPIYTHYDFDQFHDLVGRHHRTKMKTLLDESAIVAYLKVYYPDFCASPEDRAKAESEENLEDLIFDIMPPPSPAENARLYHAPRHSPLAAETSDPTGLMVMVDHYIDPDKVEEALLALSKMRHPKLRKWALERLESAPEKYLPIVMRNYENEDEFELCYELKQITVDPKDENGWHGVHLSLLSMKDYGLTPPEKALLFVYRHTYCSNCRHKAIKQLYEQKMLTSEILLEALYDSNIETREFVKSLLS